MTYTSYPLDYPQLDSVGANSLGIRTEDGGGIAIPVGTRARIVFDPSAIAASHDPTQTAFTLSGSATGDFGAHIAILGAAARTYTMAEVAAGLTIAATGTAIAGLTIASVSGLGPFVTDHAGGDYGFVVITLTGRLIVGGDVSGKPGYRRGRFEG